MVSPLEGIPRVAPSGPGEDREDGARAHRGLDIDATGGEPIASIADGVVWFTGFDLPGRVRPQVVPPDELASTKRPELGAGGLFVCIRHVPHIFSCYMHLQSYRVAINERVKAGQVIANVGHSGIKVSGTHLHLEIHRDGEALDPAPILGPELVDPAARNRGARHRHRQQEASTGQGTPRPLARPSGRTPSQDAVVV